MWFHPLQCTSELYAQQMVLIIEFVLTGPCDLTVQPNTPPRSTAQHSTQKI